MEKYELLPNVIQPSYINVWHPAFSFMVVLSMAHSYVHVCLCFPSWQHSAQSHFCATNVKGFIVLFGARTNLGRTSLDSLPRARPELLPYQLLHHCFLKHLGVPWIVAAIFKAVHNCLFQTHRLQQSPLNPYTETGRKISSI